MRTAPFCGLCFEPKETLPGQIGSTKFWLCLHCDTTVNCKGSRCGACASGRDKTYPPYPEEGR